MGSLFGIKGMKANNTDKMWAGESQTKWLDGVSAYWTRYVWHRNHSSIAGTAKHSLTIYFGNSSMLDTPRWMASNRCVAEMGVESSP